MPRLWTKARRLAKERREQKRFEKYRHSLEYQLCEVLQSHAGERGHTEGAVDCLYRIIAERDNALMILALDRLKEHRERSSPILIPREQRFFPIDVEIPMPKLRRKSKR